METPFLKTETKEFERDACRTHGAYKTAAVPFMIEILLEVLDFEANVWVSTGQKGTPHA